jgi:porphobilinogen synthase
VIHRPRRNRRNQAIRDSLQETQLHKSDFVFPLFITESSASAKQEITAMPGQYRWGIDKLDEILEKSFSLGVKSFALFPVISDAKKDKTATYSTDTTNVLLRSIEKIKKINPATVLYTDVALDPYSSDGHDGFVEDGQILNDKTLPLLADMSIAQAQAGADYVAASDMMDGRVGFIRKTLDDKGFSNTGILSYSAKYASSLYGPFREALDSAPRFGDKKTYQMNPANRIEALREFELDEQEGADILMIKPATYYLDIIREAKNFSHLPIAAYNVSGEYSMIKAAAANGWIDEKRASLESLLAIKRAGADLIFTYWALDVADAI